MRQINQLDPISRDQPGLDGIGLSDDILFGNGMPDGRVVCHAALERLLWHRSHHGYFFVAVLVRRHAEFVAGP